MTAPGGDPLFCETFPFEKPYRLGDDPRPLQVAFAALADRAAEVIARAGSDFDEVLMDRLVVLRDAEGTEREVVAEFLSDAKLLERSILQSLGETSGSAGLLEIREIKVVVRLDRLPGL